MFPIPLDTGRGEDALQAIRKKYPAEDASFPILLSYVRNLSIDCKSIPPAIKRVEGDAVEAVGSVGFPT